MICKWCGETVKSGDKTCRRCRREVSPLSDCGGFYDLVPQARNAAAPAAPAYDAPAPRPAQAPVKPVLPEKKQGGVNIITIVALALAVIFLVLTVSFSGKLKAAEAQIQDLKKELEEVEENTLSSDPVDPDKERPNVGGDKDPDNGDDPVEDAVLNATFVDGQLMVSFNETANLALRSGKNVQVVCNDGEGNLVCTLVFTGEKTDGAVHVTVEVLSPWEDVYFQWSDPEDENRPMTWEQTGTDMFEPENEVDEDDDGKSDAGKDKDNKQEESNAPQRCVLQAKLAEEPYFVLCSIEAQNGEFTIMIYNIMIG